MMSLRGLFLVVDMRMLKKSYVRYIALPLAFIEWKTNLFVSICQSQSVSHVFVLMPGMDCFLSKQFSLCRKLTVFLISEWLLQLIVHLYNYSCDWNIKSWFLLLRKFRMTKLNMQANHETSTILILGCDSLIYDLPSRKFKLQSTEHLFSCEMSKTIHVEWNSFQYRCV